MSSKRQFGPRGPALPARIWRHSSRRRGVVAGGGLVSSQRDMPQWRQGRVPVEEASVRDGLSLKCFPIRTPSLHPSFRPTSDTPSSRKPSLTHPCCPPPYKLRSLLGVWSPCLVSGLCPPPRIPVRDQVCPGRSSIPCPQCGSAQGPAPPTCSVNVVNGREGTDQNPGAGLTGEAGCV